MFEVIAYLIFGAVLSCWIYTDMTNCGELVDYPRSWSAIVFLLIIPTLWGLITIWTLFRVVKDKLNGT